MGAVDLRLGDRVRFTHELKRRTEHRDRPVEGRTYPLRDRWKLWRAEHAPYGRHGGIIVGRRTLANGVTQWEDEAGYLFDPRERFRAYLVAWHLDKRPVLVLPEHLEHVGPPAELVVEVRHARDDDPLPIGTVAP